MKFCSVVSYGSEKTDGQTDEQKDGHGQNNIPTPSTGHNNSISKKAV